MSYTLHTKQGDITKVSADFVVNASNTSLILGSGVSMAFKRHCGHLLQQQMNEALHSLGHPLAPGDVVATSAGKAANFRYVLHVAVINYHRGIPKSDKNPTIKTIETSLHNIEAYLQWYYKRYTKHITLAIPLLGCGVGGLEKEKVIMCYNDFFSRTTTFECDVIIVGYTEEDCRLLAKYLK